MPISELLRLLCACLGLLLGICNCYRTIYLILPMFLKQKPYGPEKKNRYAILIAARNEAAVLPHLLDSIHQQDYPYITTYVVADNCTDQTAELARQKGAHVFERFNRVQVGKGYALHDLLEQIRQAGELEQYDAFLIFDADNLLPRDYIRNMNRVCSDGFEAFTGCRNSKNYGVNWLSAGYALWYLHDSMHLNQSRMLLGVTCAVTGTGFGFTQSLLRKMGGSWNFFTLTEDIEFSTWCATRGVRIGYCPEAMLFDEQPVSFRQSWRQRTRWMQGGIQIGPKYLKDMLRGMLEGGRTGYSSLETTTLSLWGWCMAVLVWLLTLLTAFVTNSWAGIGSVLLTTFLLTYATLLLTGALAVYLSWNKIRATKRQKIGYVFTFPLFMMTYVPIAISAVFRKFQWQPIAHTYALTSEDMTKPVA